MHNTFKASTQSRPGALRITGARSAGVTMKVAAGASREIRQAYKKAKGSGVRLKGMRFIPSTRVDLGKDGFQVMANTIVEIARGGRVGTRSESIDSVVTVDTRGPTQVLKAVKIPSLEGEAAEKTSPSVMHVDARLPELAVDR